MGKLWKTDYDDTAVREFVIKFFKEYFNISLISNPVEKKIDLLFENNIDGVEVEHGKWNGDFWENKTYSLLSGLGFKTLNVPIRKEKYWLDVVKGKINESATKNIFVRTNKDFTQVIVIRPETFRNPEKVYRSKFQPNNSREMEDWLSFKKDDVETYNFIENNWVLDNNNR